MTIKFSHFFLQQLEGVYSLALILLYLYQTTPAEPFEIRKRISTGIVH